MSYDLSGTARFPSTREIQPFISFLCLSQRRLEAQFSYHQFVNPETQSSRPRAVSLMPGVKCGGGGGKLQA